MPPMAACHADAKTGQLLMVAVAGNNLQERLVAQRLLHGDLHFKLAATSAICKVQTDCKSSAPHQSKDLPRQCQ